MPIVRPYPIGELSPQPIPDVAPNVPAAGDLDLFGGNRARDLQLAGHNLGQASDTLGALHQRYAQQANETRVQDFTNRFLDGRRAILQTGPDAYYKLSGAEAIKGADATTAKLTALRDELLRETANPYQRERFSSILDSHLAASATGIMRHTVEQQEVYSRGVATRSIQAARAEDIADPAMIDNAVYRAEGAARVLHVGQSPEAIEGGVRAVGGSVIASVIGDRLARNDPLGVTLFREHADRLDDHTRRTLGAAADTLSNTLDASAWLRDRSAALRMPASTGDQTLDAVDTVTASAPEPPPVISSKSMLLDQDGIVGTRERLAEIESRQRALTALNEKEFTTNPARRRANQTAIDMDIGRSRAAVKAETDTLYADLRRHLTTGGPNGGPAVTPPPATIMSRLTEEQQDAVTDRINRAIAGISTATDPQTFYAIHQGLTGDDANERRRWAAKNLVQFMDRLSDQDLAALEKLQAAGDAEQRRLQAITRLANDTLRRAGIDPTPRPDAPPGSDAAQAATFNRLVHDELSAFESRGRKPTEAEAYGIVNGLKDAGIKSGWFKVSDSPASPAVDSDIPSTDDAIHQPGAELAQAGSQDDKRPETRPGTAATEPDPGSAVYREAHTTSTRRRLGAGDPGDRE
ncbi:MAG: hypothetical protein KIS73_22700 [Enhydrobacter sp.]|nr:hypothetical protein [Enhydrobacter sp.]